MQVVGVRGFFAVDAFMAMEVSVARYFDGTLTALRYPGFLPTGRKSVNYGRENGPQRARLQIGRQGRGKIAQGRPPFRTTLGAARGEEIRESASQPG